MSDFAFLLLIYIVLVQRLLIQSNAQNKNLLATHFLFKQQGMERVETLCDRLKEQLNNKASIDELMLTVQMLQAELQHLKPSSEQDLAMDKVAINLPSVFENPEMPADEKEVLQLDLDESLIEAELEQIRKAAEAKNIISFKNRKPILFDPIEDTPTLAHQKPVPTPVPENNDKQVVTLIFDDEQPSLNDALQAPKTEVSDALKELPVKDLRKAININDRFLFINELFQGDEVMFDRSIKTINSFTAYSEAEFWVRRELKTKLGWNDKDEVVKQFDHLVKRRFRIS